MPLKSHQGVKPRIIVADTLMGRGTVPRARVAITSFASNSTSGELALNALEEGRRGEGDQQDRENAIADKASPHDFRHDRVDRGRRTADEAGAVRAGAHRAGTRTHSDSVGMTADLGKYTISTCSRRSFLTAIINGDGRAALVRRGIGHGGRGFIPFATTYAVFASRRAYDFIHQTIAEEDRNVKIVCALPGLTSGYGPSHQAAEDLALFRAMPNMIVIDPCDAHEIEQVVPAIAAHHGPVYMRLLRGQVPVVLDEYGYQFELGKAKLLRDGGDVLFVSRDC